MKISFNIDRKVLVSAVIAIAIVGMIAISSRPAPPSKRDCYEDQVKTMTIQQVADLLNISLVQLSWFPNQRELIPHVTTHDVFYYNCTVWIDYADPVSPGLVPISITVDNSFTIEPTKFPTSCSWQFTPIESIGTNCTTALDSRNATVRVSFRFGAEVTPEDALRVLENMEIVEPAIKPTPTPTP